MLSRPTIAVTTLAAELRAQGRDVIGLGAGEPDFDTPDNIKAAAKAAIDAGKTKYTAPDGIPELKQAIVDKFARENGLSYTTKQISVGTGGKQILYNALMATLNPGDEVLIPAPYWVSYPDMVLLAGGEPVVIECGMETGFKMTPEQLEAAITPRTKAIYVNTPSNPTGWIMSAGEGAALLELCRRNGLGLIADEVYHRNVFEGRDPAPSFLELAGPDEPVFVLNGFSKAWAMTGWRLGWIVAPKHLVEPMAVLAECNNTGATVFAQAGGLAALEEGEDFVRSFVARTMVNRDLVMELIGSHPKVTLPEPEGAFYAFPRIDGLTDSLAFAREVLQRCKVGIAAGYTFGAGNEGHVRLCFAIRTERLRLALERLRGLLDEL